MLTRTLVAAAFLASPMCAPEIVVASNLAKKFGERMVISEERGGYTLQRWESQTAWTVIGIDERGMACVMVDGKFVRA